MTESKDPNKNQIPIATAVLPDKSSGIPSDHSRYYCSKCQAPYDLPDRTTSWRCSNCATFNSITPGQCPGCAIQ